MPLFGPPNVEKLAEKRNVRGLIRALRYRKDPNIRRSAANALNWAGDSRAVEPLIVMLRDRHLCHAATQALVKVADASALEPLLAALQDRDGDVRRGTATALGAIRDSAAIHALIAALEDGDWQVRWSAAESLGQIGDASAVEALILALGDDRFEVRWRAAASLGEIGDRCAFDALANATKDEQDTVRAYAATALGAIGDPRAAETLVLLFCDESESVRKAATGALIALRDDAIAPLRGVLEDAGVRATAVEILDRIGWQPDKNEAGAYYWIAKGDWDKCVAVGPPAIEPLLAVLRDEDIRDRHIIAESLDRLNWQPDANTGGAAYWTAKKNWEQCVRIGVAAVDPLIAALRNEASDASDRLAIVNALGQIADERAVEPLLDALIDRDPEARSASARMLAAIGDPRAVDERVVLLIHTLQDQNAPGWERIASAHALGEIGAERALDPLLAVLQDAYLGLRSEAARALGSIGNARAVEPLVKLLSSHETQLDVRRAAAEALVALYTSGSLDDAHRRAILSLRDTIVSGHHDVHTDFERPGACYDVHDDTAIGVDFPL